MASLQSQGGRGGSTVGSFCQGRWLSSLVNGQQLSQGTLSLGQGLWKYIDLLHLYTAVILWDERGAIKAHTCHPRTTLFFLSVSTFLLVLSLSFVSVTPWAVARQLPLSRPLRSESETQRKPEVPACGHERPAAVPPRRPDSELPLR